MIKFYLMKRCSWVNENSKLYIDYHDNEWGEPVYDDRLLFEMLVLEFFQSGLNWLTILKKREGFKKAFDNFDVVKISKYKSEKINELMNNSDIIRNRAKIDAAIENAKIFIQIQKEFGSFSNYIWSFTNNKVVKYSGIHTQSALSDTISKDLKHRGMKRMGSITIYSYLQAIGVINDHEPDCFKY